MNIFSSMDIFFCLLSVIVFTNQNINAKIYIIYGDVPKWSYRDALEMRLSSNRHESSNLSVSANKGLKRTMCSFFFVDIFG